MMFSPPYFSGFVFYLSLEIVLDSIKEIRLYFLVKEFSYDFSVNDFLDAKNISLLKMFKVVL